jgi:hypothetical protein
MVIKMPTIIIYWVVLQLHKIAGSFVIFLTFYEANKLDKAVPARMPASHEQTTILIFSPRTKVYKEER